MAINSPNMLRTAAVATLERAINFALRYDPGTTLKLESLHGQVFAIECTEPALILFIHIDAPMRLSEHYDGPVTTRIVGSLKDFTQLATAEDPAGALINSDISVHGKSGPLIELQQIFKLLDVDWEEPIAEIIGDVPAHHVGVGIRRAAKFAKTLPPKLQTRIEKHLYEESKLLPTRADVDQWVDGVAKLNIDIERMRARVMQLRNRRQRGAGS